MKVHQHLNPSHNGVPSEGLETIVHGSEVTQSKQNKMASNYSNIFESSGVHVVALSEDDILGSSLSGRKPEELKNQELLFWLKCRGDNGKGLKSTVARKCHNTIQIRKHISISTTHFRTCNTTQWLPKTHFNVHNTFPN